MAESPGIGGPPIVLSPATYERVSRVVDYIERTSRVVIPRAKRGKTTTPSAGAWGWLAPGDAITGVSGMTLGEGDVVLCSRDGADLTADGDVVHVYNPGRYVKAGPNGLPMRLAWMDDYWSPVLSPFAVGKANGTIPPRLGTDYGFGHVDLYESGSAYGYGYGYGYGEAVGPVGTVDVLNASSTTVSSGVSIAHGTYCSVAWDVNGVAWVAPLEC